ncbi:Dor1-like family protein-like protein [Delitschia confertaspora ATCC 74209]|uniref:Conserved oligomeric Golgi complex subunit 8 n=1 Tax=Delitschia confertaspora ATCC 74209 TaxID=1513339 RepID=A0A9P4N1Z2_9PLEO|nr:Dor1-like family protein-like protein [Delitschia confertaspora ATCC 74209]
MADPLYELLIPYFDAQDAKDATIGRPSPSDAITATYLSRLTTLPLSALTSSEPHSLSQTSHSIHRSLQSLSKRSHKPLIHSADHLSHLCDTLPKISQHAADIKSELPNLDTAAQKFAEKYSKSAENPLLDRRRKAQLLSQNIDRISSILDLPTLLSSAISSSTAPSQATSNTTSSATTANYTSALDLHAHIKRLHTLYPNSALIASLAEQAEREMKVLTTNLIAGLQAQGIKLAGAMRTVGWLRRVAPELDQSYNPSKGSGSSIGSGEGALGALFLVCRLANLMSMLEALDPLRELADQETSRRIDATKTGKGVPGMGNTAWQGGQQTERYLKRYIEIFREQSFAIISMYKSIFPSALPFPDSATLSTLSTAPPNPAEERPSDNPLQPLPSPLATFPIHLTDLLFDTLRQYLPNVIDRSARDSLLTQVLYCAGSLGRLGSDFGLMVACLEEDLRVELAEIGMEEGGKKEGGVEGDKGGREKGEEEGEWEWVDVMKKHRVQASRLELLASGVGTARPGAADRSGSGSPGVGVGVGVH